MVSFVTAPTSNHATSISSRPASAPTDTSSLPLFSVHRRSQSGTSFVSSLTSMGRRSTSSATDSRSDAVSDFILQENHQRQQRQQQFQHFPQQFQQRHQHYRDRHLRACLPSAEAYQAVCSDGRIGGAGARATTVASLLPDGIGPGIIELESESELDFESADEHPHILSESFVTNIPAASQFPATFGFRLTPYEPCERIPSADRPLNFAQMLATLLAALPSHHVDLRDSSPVRGPGNRNGGKVAFILTSAQEASKANCKLSESVRRRREAAMASSLAARISPRK
ncbi:unnamed protein product [Tilletia controversa]|uniref:Uncharacterized protein n=2 Tax=Tilletia TaxID=13289 RepID=A0A177VCV1_9BASI|nr:hypothetical protein CF336_g7322 [Tilletia laevis]KAE8257979.1 hypothetical protein A4X03_0g4516 [Tilletia caries]CAD6900682.1 unnamed protein product [Tilletia controversa]CAD6902625.1 unnamed protein product [Tilletia caries]CAD6910666.1 unnamed protein product [Tilletia caries]